jgi:hypothetical protein
MQLRALQEYRNARDFAESGLKSCHSCSGRKRPDHLAESEKSHASTRSLDLSPHSHNHWLLCLLHCSRSDSRAMSLEVLSELFPIGDEGVF